MRKGSNNSFLMTEDEKTFIGVCLGANFCSEHEQGIEKLEHALGINQKNREEDFYSRGWWKTMFSTDKPVLGIEKRAINKLPENYYKLITGEIKFSFIPLGKEKNKIQKDVAYLVVDDFYGESDKTLIDYLEKSIKQETYAEHEIDSWWSQGDFMISSSKKEYIKELYDAFLNKDIAIWVAGGKPFAGNNLIIAIKSRIPESSLQALYEQDENYHNLKVAVQKTGICEKLEKANKKYFALTPKWEFEDGKKKISFWLNPYEQKENNSGWYTVEELEQWIENKGPIPKQKEEVK